MAKEVLNPGTIYLALRCHINWAPWPHEPVSYVVFRRAHIEGKGLTGGKGLTEAAKVAGRLS